MVRWFNKIIKFNTKGEKLKMKICEKRKQKLTQNLCNPFRSTFPPANARKSRFVV
jgi:hypothetical protein